MGKLVHKISKDLYSSTFLRRNQRGGSHYAYPVYRGKMRGGLFPIKNILRFTRGLVQNVSKNAIKELKKEVIKRGMRAAPAVLAGKKTVGAVAKENFGGVVTHMAKSMPKIVGRALTGEKNKPKGKKKKKKKKKVQQKGGVHSLGKQGKKGTMNRQTNIFGE